MRLPVPRPHPWKGEMRCGAKSAGGLFGFRCFPEQLALHFIHQVAKPYGFLQLPLGIAIFQHPSQQHIFIPDIRFSHTLASLGLTGTGIQHIVLPLLSTYSINRISPHCNSESRELLSKAVKFQNINKCDSIFRSFLCVLLATQVLQYYFYKG
jgi:hypothetical protein